MDLPLRVRAGAGAAAVQVLPAVPSGVSKSDRGGYRGRSNAPVGQQGGVDERVRLRVMDGDDILAFGVGVRAAMAASDGGGGALPSFCLGSRSSG